MKGKQILLPLVVIGATALLLYGSRRGLSGIGAINEEKEFYDMLAVLSPGSSSFEREAYEGDEMIRAVYQGETGYVLQTVSHGYAGDIIMLVGVSKEGKVTGLVVRDMSETCGLGANALRDTEFLSQFLGTSGNAEIGNGIDALTGATVSSKAVAKAVNAAAAYVTGADVSSGATTWGGR